MARSTVAVKFTGDTADLKRALNSVDGQMRGIGSKLASFGKTAAIGLGGLAAGGVVLAKGFIDAATESAKVTKQTDAVLKSMGNQAGITAKQVANLSEKLAAQTGIDDELIQSGQNILLTFGQVRNGIAKTDKVFDRATQAALDMSVALGTDMTSAAMLVGKALNDPIRGLTALRRSGIQFTESQTDQIKVMVEAGDVMGAQKIMLEELERQFGGSAEAQATAGQKLGVVWGNLQEKLGEKLLPVFEKVANWLAAKLPAAIDAATPFLSSAAEMFGDVAEAVREFVQDRLEELGEWWDKNGPGIIATAKDLADEFQEHVLPVLTAFATFVKDKVIPVLVGIAVWCATNKPVLIGIAAIISGVLVAAFFAWAVAAAQAAVATTLATWPIIAIGVAVGLLAAALIYVSSKWDDVNSNVWKVRFALGEVRKFIEPVAVAFWFMASAVWGAVKAVGDLLGKLGSLPSKLGTVGKVLGGITRGPSALLGTVGGLLGGLADGTDNWRGGLTWVGERGPELVNLPRGSQVFDAATSRTMARSGGSIAAAGGSQIIQLVVDGRVLAQVVADQDALHGRNRGDR